MRGSRLFVIGLFAALLTTSVAQAADGPRSFGTIPCQQKFVCGSLDPSQLSEMANTCTVRGFGLSAQQTDIFASSSLDENNCMDGQTTAGGNNGHTMSPHCCIIASDDECAMSCQLLMY